jgi:hypothetical protein
MTHTARCSSITTDEPLDQARLAQLGRSGWWPGLRERTKDGRYRQFFIRARPGAAGKVNWWCTDGPRAVKRNHSVVQAQKHGE